VRIRHFRPLLAGAFIIPFVLSRCIPYEYNSRWLDRAIAIDGLDDDWQAATVYVEKANVSVGMFNDSETMVLCLVSTDRRIGGRIMRGRLKVWFDPDGGQKKSFGIHFPAGVPDGDPGRGGMEGEFPGSDSESPDLDFFTPQTDLEILGPGNNDIERMPADDARGIRVRTAVDSGRFVYELKVPLSKSESAPHAVGIGSKRQVAVGFEIEDFTATGERGRMGGRGMPPGGGDMGGGSGMAGGTGMDRDHGMGDGQDMGGPGTGRPGADRFAKQKQVNLWILVNLASPVSSDGG
jgi:hypothetical protein